MKQKQSIDSIEPYYVHIGYTYTYELRKYKRKDGRLFKRGRLKVRAVVKKRLDKLNRYWGDALK